MKLRYPTIKVDREATATMHRRAKALGKDPEARGQALAEVAHEHVVDAFGAWRHEAGYEKSCRRRKEEARTAQGRLADLRKWNDGGLVRALAFLEKCVVPASRYSKEKARRGTSYGWKH